jgi:predicted GH43/DUF377 family glycosyl hydrolase
MAFELRVPGKVETIEPPLGTHVFNGGLVESFGKLLSVYRINQRPSLLGVSELDADLRPVSTKILWDTWDPVFIPEDPRAIAFDDGVYLMWVGVNSKDFSKATIIHAQLDADNRIVWKSPCWFEWQDHCEKNWVPFVRGGELLAVYNYDPLTIIRYSAGAWRAESLRRFAWGWKYGHMSGGAPPVWHNGRWYCFFHSSGMKDGVKVYYSGCCTLDEDLNPLAITPNPILSGATHVFVEPSALPWRPGSRVSAVFPCGAVFRGGEWLVSYGYLDQELRIARFSMETLHAALSPIGGRAS